MTGLGIPTPSGNAVWSGGTIKSILTNEKYKGCALLQKGYTEDYLTMKRVKNDGAVPQYFVEDSYPAIIEPAAFDRVQDLIDQRSRRENFSGSTIFSAKIRCGECGSFMAPRSGTAPISTAGRSGDATESTETKGTVVLLRI